MFNDIGFIDYDKINKVKLRERKQKLKGSLKYQAGSLEQFQSMNLDCKIQYAKRRILNWVNTYGVDKCYIGYSGGKDSSVLKHLVQSMFPSIPAIFCNTGMEYPEVIKHVRSDPNVRIIKPEMQFTEITEKYGFPVVSKLESSKLYTYRITQRPEIRDKLVNSQHRISLKWQYLINAPFKISHYCCYHLKKRPYKQLYKKEGLVGFIGTTTDESMNRRKSWQESGCNAIMQDVPKSMPLSIWTEQDVLEYIDRFNIKVPSIYGDLVKEDGKYRFTNIQRTGCMFCMYGLQYDKGENRFQKMARTHPKHYKFCIDKMGIGKVLDYMGYDYKPN